MSQGGKQTETRAAGKTLTGMFTMSMTSLGERSLSSRLSLSSSLHDDDDVSDGDEDGVSDGDEDNDDDDDESVMSTSCCSS